MGIYTITLGNLTGFRHTLNNGCIGKKIYPSFKHARFTIDVLKRNNAHRPDMGRLDPYECRKCGRIHIGHTPVRAR